MAETKLAMDKEFRSIELWRCVVSECLATFFYVFLSCLVTINWEPNVYRIGVSSADILTSSLASGLAYLALTQSFGHISGGHINPAVTLGSAVTCKTSPLRALFYVIAQCGGGIAGAALLYGIVPEDLRGDLGVCRLHADLSPAQGFAVEFLLSFLFVFTFNATVDPKRRNNGNQAVPLGLTVVLVHLIGVRLTGCGCNPARSLGPAFIRNDWINHWIYWAGPMSGGLLSSLLYHFIFDPSRTNKSPVEVYKEQYSVLRHGEYGLSLRRPSLVSRANGHENNAYENARAYARGQSLRTSKRNTELSSNVRNEHNSNGLSNTTGNRTEPHMYTMNIPESSSSSELTASNDNFGRPVVKY